MRTSPSASRRLVASIALALSMTTGVFVDGQAPTPAGKAVADIDRIWNNDVQIEYACHEGNYALPDILRGARSEEKTGRPY